MQGARGTLRASPEQLAESALRRPRYDQRCKDCERGCRRPAVVRHPPHRSFTRQTPASPLSHPRSFPYTAAVSKSRGEGTPRIRAGLLGPLATLLLAIFVPLSSATQAQAPSDLPGTPAPPEVIEQVQRTLLQAVARFEARDAAGVLVHVSEAYRTGPLRKATLRDQLVGIFSVYDAVQARVRIDEIRMVGEAAWIYSTGHVTGRLPLIGRWMQVLAWDRELEIARRENGAWRLFGYQQ
jgi:hypothetical protein